MNHIVAGVYLFTQKQLKLQDKGNKPTDEEINILYNRNVLGSHTPQPLLNTLIWLNKISSQIGPKSNRLQSNRPKSNRPQFKSAPSQIGLKMKVISAQKNK